MKALSRLAAQSAAFLFVIIAIACGSGGDDYRAPSITEDSALTLIPYQEMVSLVAQNGNPLVTVDEKNYLPAHVGGNYSQSIGSVGMMAHNITPYEIGQYEVTYELWYTVRIWAEEHGYTFANLGREGNLGTDGAVPTETGKFEPVTMLNWRDAIVWCNAYSEMAKRTPCYYTDNTLVTVLKASSNDVAISAVNGDIDKDCVNWNANGYRLPTEGEWQYAASCAGLYPYWCASGAETVYNDKVDVYSYVGDVWTETTNGVPDNKDANDAVAVYDGFFSSTGGWITKGVTKTARVGSKRPNAYSLYDMSGNVQEFCWDWLAGDSPGPVFDYNGPLSGSNRIIKGGGWEDLSIMIVVGPSSAPEPNRKLMSLGFRVVRRP